MPHVTITSSGTMFIEFGETSAYPTLPTVFLQMISLVFGLLALPGERDVSGRAHVEDAALEVFEHLSTSSGIRMGEAIIGNSPCSAYKLLSNLV
jgi:hypothetical protein